MLVPEVTPVDSFYITTKNFVDPTVDGNSWTLSFKGMVDNAYSINLKQLQALPSSMREETLSCISNPIGGNLVGNAQWKGVSFADLLKKAKPQSGVVDVVVRAADGYADSFPLACCFEERLYAGVRDEWQATRSEAWLSRPPVGAQYIRHEELQVDHRGRAGEQRLQRLLGKPGLGRCCRLYTESRIDYPNTDHIPANPIYVGGIAFAGNRGIKKVEVSTDGGQTWNEAQVRTPAGPYTWVLWTYPWKPTNGLHTLVVRATDGTGAVQTGDEADTYPAGATGYHSINVRVG